jgi:outer membrane protein assembly factor BamB
VYVATDDGVVRTIGVDGEGGWAREVAAPVRGGVAVTDARAVVGTEAAEVAALDRDDGSIAWRAATRGPVRGTPAVAGDTDPTAYAADNDGTLSAFDVGDGSVRFRVRVGRWADAPPAVGFGAVFVADGTGRVAADVGEKPASAGRQSGGRGVRGPKRRRSRGGRLRAVPAGSGPRVWGVLSQ